MAIFEFLPKVNKFCGCIKNLKCASFIVIFLGMITSISTASVLCDPYCKELYSADSPVKLASNILRWVLFICELSLIASLFALLLGLFWSLQVTAIVAICFVLIKYIISILYSVIIIIQEQYTGCHWYHSQVFNLIMFLIMWSYFILVINTYAESIQ